MKISLVLLLVCVVSFSAAANIQWTGGAGNSLWNFVGNWDSNSLPTKDDNVIINLVGGASVTVAQPAFALSIRIAGGAFAQTLTLLSSLSVGTGGLTIADKGTLQLQGNNELPLSSTGKVVALSGGAVIFNSGDIKGPGSYTINAGANIVFSGSALKLIEATDLSILGTATIQPTTIQLASGATFTNSGTLLAVGLITIFSNDNSQASFYSYETFTYQGAQVAQPLTFQLNTYFAKVLDIVSGAVVINGYFYSVGNVSLPIGTTLSIRSGTDTKTFTNVIGAGSFIIEGATVVIGSLDVSWVTISDSGSLTLSANGSTKVTAKSLSVSGKVVLGNGTIFTVTDASVVAGNLNGGGTIVSTGNFEIAVSSTGNINSFISVGLNISGNAYLTGSPYILFGEGANIHIKANATLKITATAHFGNQGGKPIITNNGKFIISLPVSSTFDSNVDIVGGGDTEITSGLVTFEANNFVTNNLALGGQALFVFRSATIKVGTVSGSGSLNVSASPEPNSTFGDISLAYFGVEAGNIVVKSINVNTLELFSGVLYLPAGSANKATIFNFYGGTAQGAGAHIAAATLLISGDTPQIIDGVIITASKGSLVTKNQGTVLSSNKAQIVIG